MKHLTDDDLVLHYYGELPEADAHLSECERCRAERARLAEDLASFAALPPIPERDEAYAEGVWRAVRRRAAAATRPPRSFGWKVWALSASLAALLVGAFLAGRLSRSVPEQAALGREARERVLRAEVADHLDRAQIALLEFLHAEPGDGAASRSRELARELADSNRLYRQTASREGDTGVVGALDELERVLLEIVHSPTPETRQALRRRIEEDGTLFKIRVVRSRIGAGRAASAPPAARS